MYDHQNRYGKQWQEIEDLNVGTHSYTHLSFEKTSKNALSRNWQMIQGKSDVKMQKNDIRPTSITLDNIRPRCNRDMIGKHWKQ